MFANLTPQPGDAAGHGYAEAKAVVERFETEGAHIVQLDHNLNHAMGMIRVGAIKARAPDAKIMTGGGFSVREELAPKKNAGFVSKDGLTEKIRPDLECSIMISATAA